MYYAELLSLLRYDYFYKGFSDYGSYYELLKKFGHSC